MCNYLSVGLTSYSKERKLTNHLPDCFQDRRAELEGLDLAIERQKGSLTQMRESEHILLAEREAARKELAALKRGASAPKSRK